MLLLAIVFVCSVVVANYNVCILCCIYCSYVCVVILCMYVCMAPPGKAREERHLPTGGV